MAGDNEILARIEEQTSKIFAKLYNGLDDKIDRIQNDVAELKEELAELQNNIRWVKILLVLILLAILGQFGLKLAMLAFAQMNNAQIIYLPAH